MAELPFNKVLVANRGEIAVRVIRTCRRLGIRTVAVYSDADEAAQHVQFADERVYIGKSRAQDSYLNRAALVDAIRSTGADAVHPGYGLLSEDPEFAAAVRGAGVTFVGPNEENLTRFGDKLTARAFAGEAGIESPPGTTEPVNVADSASVQAAAADIGYPVLVKASAGGGGIGMQPVQAAEQLLSAVETCAARGKAAFGDERVYIERFIPSPRHIEVQVLADRHGNVVALGERECSVQRRHQKIVEESPSPATPLSEPSLRARLHQSAAQLLRSSGYEGAGTVEFLADFSTAEPRLYFLEVNARLQVEHPVTELCYGADLVEAQLRIAAGEPLPPELREPHSRGHAVEVRLYAEDPERKFMPQPGQLQLLQWPDWAAHGPCAPTGDPLLRIDSGYASGDQITPYYDPMIAKVTAWAEDRGAAFDCLARGLAQTKVEIQGPKGPRASNLMLLRKLADDPTLRSGTYDTGLVAQLGY